MPLFCIEWEAGASREAKAAVRRNIATEMGALAGIDPSFIAVLFRELPKGDMSALHGSFTQVYISEGRTDAFKDRVAALVTDAICGATGWPADKVNVIIHDLLRGSVAVNGLVANRAGPAANAVSSREGG